MVIGGFLLSLFFAFFLFFLLQGGNHAVDGSIAVFLIHLCQCLEGVLQGYGIGEGYQFVEHLGAVGELLVVLALLVEQADGFAVAALGIGEFLSNPVDVAQMQEEHTFLYAASGGLGNAFLVGSDGLQGVFLSQVDITDGIVYLIEIFLVVVGCRHALQLAYHLPAVVCRHHLGHRDAGVELQFVRRIEAHHVLECLVGFLLVADGSLQLSHQVPFACLLLAAHLVADYLFEIRNRLCRFALADMVVGKGVIPFLLGTPVDGIAPDVADYIFCIIHPVLFYVAFSQPGTSLAVDGRLGGVEAAHVGEGGSCRIEVALEELRSTHQHPGFPQEGVVLTAAEPFNILFCLLSAFCPFRSALDTVLVNGFLAFFDGTVVVTLTYFTATLVGNGVEWNLLGIVVLVACFFLQRGINIGECTIIIGIVSGVEGMPPSALRRILLRRTSDGTHRDDDEHDGVCQVSCRVLMLFHFFWILIFSGFLSTILRWQR